MVIPEQDDQMEKAGGHCQGGAQERTQPRDDQGEPFQAEAALGAEALRWG